MPSPRSRPLRVVMVACFALAAFANCAHTGPHDGGADGDGGVSTLRISPTRGSAMIVSPDDSLAIAVNRRAGSVAVFQTDLHATPPNLTSVATIDLGAGSEPWVAVFSNDSDTAYVVLRQQQRIVRLDRLHTAPHVGAMAATASEPTGIAITPSGASVLVTNFGEGTLTVYSAPDLTTTHTVDLNAALVATGTLGPIAARPALAHPRGVVVTDDGDGNDANETAYVTEFYGQYRPVSALPSDDSSFDVEKEGFVYAVDLGSFGASTISISPVDDTGFPDSQGHRTGCFPNQLQAPTLHDGKLYVSSSCASPRGPVGHDASYPDDPDTNFKTLVHPVIFVIDTQSRSELRTQRIVLDRAFRDRYDNELLADSADNPAGFFCDGARRRYPLLPTDMAFVAGTGQLYVSAYGANAVFLATIDSQGNASVGSDASDYIDLVEDDTDQDRLPVGIAIANDTPGVALVANEYTRHVSALDLGAQRVARSVESAAPASDPSEVAAEDGHRFFVTGAGRWGYRGQGFASCESCHPDGHSDGVTWYFGRGPRQPPSLAGSYAPDGSRRMFSWTASFDEVQDLESITRSVQGGVGAIVWQMNGTPTPADDISFDGSMPGGLHSTMLPQNFLNGSTAAISHPMDIVSPSSVIDFYDRVEHYVATIREPRPPVGLDAGLIATGQQVFVAHGCAGCHGGPRWTVSRVFYSPGVSNNNPMPGIGILRTRTYTLPAMFPQALNPWAARQPTGALLRFYDTDAATTAANDSIECSVRSVGTFPTGAAGPDYAGISTGAVRIREVRQDMVTLAQGADGFNPPALIDLATSAPYFHAGNARTLEEALGPTFSAHANAFVSTPLSDADIHALVAFLLSIDKTTTPIEPVVPGSAFNPELCPQLE